MAITGGGGNTTPTQITNIVEQQSFLAKGHPAKSLDMADFHREPTVADITEFMDPTDTRGKKFHGMGKTPPKSSKKR